MQLFQFGDQHAGANAPFQLTADPHPLDARLQAQHDRIGGNPAVALHQHHTGGLGGRGQFVQVCPIPKGFRDIQVRGFGGLPHRFGQPLGVLTHRGDRGGETCHGTVLRGFAQSFCGSQRGGSLAFDRG